MYTWNTCVSWDMNSVSKNSFRDAVVCYGDICHKKWSTKPLRDDIQVYHRTNIVQAA